jgi:3-dehydroquinate synthase
MDKNLISEQIGAISSTDRDSTGLHPQNLFLFGPPGVGKTTVGKLLAERLGRPFIDIDESIERQQGQSVNILINTCGEAAFRRIESEFCAYLAGQSNLVVASGGGALLNPEIRSETLASSCVILLTAEEHELVDRLGSDTPRPLLGGNLAQELRQLLNHRKENYASFPFQVPTSEKSPSQVVDTILEALADNNLSKSFTVRNPKPGYEILLGPGLLTNIDTLISRLELQPPYIMISDSNVGPVHAQGLQSRLNADLIQFEAGEQKKNLGTYQELVQRLTELGMERSGTLIAIGGGVVGDLAGFTAATYMRGIRWMNLPTSIVAMVDASIGGKVGVDLGAGKNLVGAFHQPDIVVADTDTLRTLPEGEFKAGLAEIIKAAVIADATLFKWFERNQHSPTLRWLERAIALKVDIVQEDPYESGIRAKLNLGHTIGHGLEAASNYTLRHGEAVGLGMLIEAELAEDLRLTEEGLASRIEKVLQRWDLPTRFRDIPIGAIRKSMMNDKKKRRGGLRFALPLRVGSVQLHENIPDSAVMEAIERRMEI